MSLNFRICCLFVALCAFSMTALSQEISREEWEKQMKDLTAQRDQLKSRMSSLRSDVDNLRQQDRDKDAALKKCNDELMAMIGAEAASMRAFEAELDRIDQWLDELSRLSNQDLWNRKKELDDVQSAISAGKKNKLSALPKNYDRLGSQQNRLDSLRKSLESVSMAMTYTVGTWAKDRDCLWNIAKKPTIYDNAFLWPKIWQGNRDQIKNPDIIHTGQKLKVPSKADLTAEEKSAVKMYWQKKQAAPAVNKP